MGNMSPLMSTYVAEISPAFNRGKRYVIMGSTFIIGELIPVFFAYYSFEKYGNIYILMHIYKN